MEWYRVGKIKEAHGLKGDVYILIFSAEFTWLEENKSPEIKLVNLEGELHGIFKIKKYRAHKMGFIAQLEGMDNRNQSEAIKGFLVEIPKTYLTTDDSKKDQFYLQEISGFKVLDQSGELLGLIVGFSSNQVQDLILIENEGWRFEAPLVDEFIIELNHKEKLIKMNLPEGLKDLGHEV